MSFLPIIMRLCTMIGYGLDSQTVSLTDEEVAAQKQAIAFERLGGDVDFGKKNPNKPVRRVSLTYLEITDGDLVQLPALTSLQTLELNNTNDGLEHLKRLTKLGSLKGPNR